MSVYRFIPYTPNTMSHQVIICSIFGVIPIKKDPAHIPNDAVDAKKISMSNGKYRAVLPVDGTCAVEALNMNTPFVNSCTIYSTLNKVFVLYIVLSIKFKLFSIEL